MEQQPQSQSRARVVELAARWYVFIFLNIYGIGKILGGQFYRRGHLPPDVASLTLDQAGPFELAWTFMGYSFAYIFFIGIAEVAGAWFLLWNRTKLIGVAILLPIMVNIIVFDVIFLDKYGALASATIYTLLLFLIVALNGDRVLQAIRTLLPSSNEAPSPFAARAKAAAFALMLMAALFAFDQTLVNFFGHGKG
ncbi:MAG: hypothetical protein FJW30_05330 [Acidobacteria bacterium]|nr:hypothetical protein [Acidobacteriota bacterium]